MARVTVGGPHKRGGNMLHFTLQSKDSEKARQGAEHVTLACPTPRRGPRHDTKTQEAKMKGCTKMPDYTPTLAWARGEARQGAARAWVEAAKRPARHS
ncbi:hypothetical protein E2C01_012307 [Portunus trituberculatus]|uniref:Uncharacterized protein n=1 Tax=Portunus trituberculatus TaxID=210409 RepID=A0A5B7DDR3_PORTR|nr:hypothetical protein [Portunus trituberculatus]